MSALLRAVALGVAASSSSFLGHFDGEVGGGSVGKVVGADEAEVAESLLRANTGGMRMLEES